MSGDPRAEAFKLRADGVATKAIARQLDIPRSTVRNWFQVQDLKDAARRGDHGTKPLLPGFEISQTSAQLDSTGAVEKEWIKQKPERGEVFALPEGQIVKGVSALVDGDGKTLAKWIKTREGSIDPVAVIKEALSEFKTWPHLPPAPTFTDNELATAYVIGDHHLGMYAYHRETGSDYDVEIAKRLLLTAAGELVALSPPAKVGLIINVGDFFHMDSPRNMTERSGNVLDVDTRWPMVARAGVELMIDVIGLALQKHEQVVVINAPGNHDPNTTVMLSIALAQRFHAEPRVKVDLGESKFFKFRFGKVLIGVTHGDMQKLSQADRYLAAAHPKDWGDTEHRYIIGGHLHSAIKGGEIGGCTFEHFETMAAKDKWHTDMGYMSARSMTAITYHILYGECGRHRTIAKPFQLNREAA